MIKESPNLHPMALNPCHWALSVGVTIPRRHSKQRPDSSYEGEESDQRCMNSCMQRVHDIDVIHLIAANASYCHHLIRRLSNYYFGASTTSSQWFNYSHWALSCTDFSANEHRRGVSSALIDFPGIFIIHGEFKSTSTSCDIELQEFRQ